MTMELDHGGNVSGDISVELLAHVPIPGWEMTFMLPAGLAVIRDNTPFPAGGIIPLSQFSGFFPNNGLTDDIWDISDAGVESAMPVEMFWRSPGVAPENPRYNFVKLPWLDFSSPQQPDRLKHWFYEDGHIYVEGLNSMGAAIELKLVWKG
jgi:hypothetical protein